MVMNDLCVNIPLAAVLSGEYMGLFFFPYFPYLNVLHKCCLRTKVEGHRLNSVTINKNVFVNTNLSIVFKSSCTNDNEIQR